jgi:nicotinate-nucleotide adenylyltransferase
MRLGIFGGTFDPIHVGHLVTAVNVRSLLELDEVALVVANEPWQKIGDRTITPALDRFAVVEAAVAATHGLFASAMEIERGGPSYTIDTVEQLYRSDPGGELFLIVGADVVDELPSWKRVDDLRAAVTLVVVNRPGNFASLQPSADSLKGWRVRSVVVPALEISSTDLRDRAAAGRPLDFLVPEAAIRVIAQRGLYANWR